jgi:acyl-CoA thioester hydrolase
MSNPPHPPNATPHRLRVLFADTDAMSVAYHGRYWPWFEAGRGAYLRARGYTYREMEAGGVALIVLETQCRYRAAARYDDPLLLYTWVSEFGRVRLRFQYALYHEETNRLLAEAETVHAFVDLHGRPLRITHYPHVWERLQQLMAPAEPEK